MKKSLTLTKEVDKELTLCTGLNYLYDRIDDYSYSYGFKSFEYILCSDNHMQPFRYEYKIASYQYEHDTTIISHSYKYKLVEDYYYPMIDNVMNYTYKLADYVYDYE